MLINPYLGFDGKCEEAFNLYAKTLGGTITAMMRYDATPMAAQMPPEMQKKIIHARMAIGDQVLMGGDAPPGRHSSPQGMMVSIGVDTAAEAERIFATLSDGGNVTMPLQQTFWALRFGMWTDRFGIPWMVNCEASPS